MGSGLAGAGDKNKDAWAKIGLLHPSCLEQDGGLLFRKALVDTSSW